MASLMRSIASLRGRTPASAKKHVCKTMLMRPGSPTSRAIRPRVDDISCMCIVRICSWTGRESAFQTRSGGCAQLSSNVRRRAARPSTSTRSSSPNWWQPTKPACWTRYGARIGRGPKRRCDTVCEPDFLES